MPLRLDAGAPDFARAFERLVAAKRAAEENVDAAVGAIVADVKARGDAALLEYTARFDRLNLTAAGLRLPAERIEQAMARAPEKAVAALQKAAL
ncbi:MAG TPA: histidinol dehydrogenase, partial [Alphaproteobacteria bacterium]